MKVTDLDSEIQKIFTSGPVVYFQWEPVANWPVRYVSPNVEQFGYAAADLTEHRIKFAQIVHPEDLERIKAEVAEFSRSGKDSFEQSYRIITPEHKHIWLYDHTYIVRNSDGLIDRYEGYVIDISELKNTEQIIVRNEKLFRTVADFTYDWEYWLSPDYRLLYCSPSAEEISGYSPQELTDNPDLIIEMIHPEDRHIARMMLDDENRSIQAHELEYRIITKSGQMKWIGHRSRHVFDENGKWMGKRSSNRDITTRKMVEDDLREIEQRVSFALEATNDGLWDWNIATDDVYYSARFFTMLGFHPDEFPQRFETFEQLIHPQDSSRIMRQLYEYIEKKRDYFEDEFRMKTATEDWVWVLARGKIVEWDDFTRPIRFVGTTENITTRKSFENALKQSEANLRTIINSTNRIILFLNNQHMILDYNQNTADDYSEQCGKSVSAGDSIDDFLSGYELTDYYEHIHRVNHTSSEAVFRKNNDTGQYYEYEFIPVISAFGDKIGMVYIKQDVTDRLDVIADIYSQNHYKQLLDHIEAPVIRFKPDGTIIYTNNAFANLNDKPVEELVGTRFFHLFPAEEIPDVIESFNRLKPESPEQSYEKAFKSHTGKVLYHQWTDRAVHDQDGNLVEYQCFGFNIHPYKTFMEKNKDDSQQLRAFVGQSLDGIGITDENGRIIEWNDGMVRITGVDASNAKNNFLWDIYFQLIPQSERNVDSYQEIKTNFQSILRNGETEWAGKLHEERIYHKQRVIRYLQTVYFPVDTSAGFRLGFISRDITPLRHSRQLLEMHRNLTLALSCISELDQAFEILLDYLSGIELIRMGAVYIAAPNKKGFQLQAQIGLPDWAIDEMSHISGNQVEAEIIRQGDPAYLKPNDLPATSRKRFRNLNLSYLAILPFKHINEVMGALYIGSWDNDVFSDMDRDALESVAALIGAVVIRIRVEKD